MRSIKDQYTDCFWSYTKWLSQDADVKLEAKKDAHAGKYVTKLANTFGVF